MQLSSVVHCVWRTWQVYRQHQSPLAMSQPFTDGVCVSRVGLRYNIIVDAIQAEYQLNSNLSKIHQWATKWPVTFNPSKSESVMVSRTHYKPNQHNVVMPRQPIQDVNSHKNIGIFFSSDCMWQEHLKSVTSKTWPRIYVMREKIKLDRKSLKLIYFTFFCPILNYSDLLRNNCT